MHGRGKQPAQNGVMYLHPNLKPNWNINLKGGFLTSITLIHKFILGISKVFQTHRTYRNILNIRGIQLKKPPPCCRSGNNKGGFLNKVSQKMFASGGKTPIFGRFRVFLIAVNVFKIFVFSSVTTLSTVPVLKTIYDSIIMMGWQRAAGENFGDLESPKTRFSLQKQCFWNDFQWKKQQNREKSDTFLRNPPPCCRSGSNKGGGFLKRGGGCLL